MHPLNLDEGVDFYRHLYDNHSFQDGKVEQILQKKNFYLITCETNASGHQYHYTLI